MSTVVDDTFPALRDDVAIVQERALALVQTLEDADLDDLVSHLAAGGGKSLRPALTLLASYLCAGEPWAPTNDRVVLAAAACELLHLGSLYHDDVMDEGETRRGLVSANARWGNLLAVLGGDFLFAKSAEVMADLGGREAGIMARTLRQLCSGQMLECRWLFDLDRSPDDYLGCIEGKTAALMATACELGALETGADEDAQHRLHQFGWSLGLAFQICDDLLDLLDDDDVAGKPTGHDLEEGVYTLPVIWALESDRTLRRLLEANQGGGHTLEALELVRASDGIGRAADLARQHLDDCVRLLADLPSGHVVTADLLIQSFVPRLATLGVSRPASC